MHEAWLKDGTHVAVKVQHRDIDEIVRLDLKTIRRILAIVTYFVPVQGMDAYYHQVKHDDLGGARLPPRGAQHPPHRRQLRSSSRAVRFPVPGRAAVHAAGDGDDLRRRGEGRATSRRSTPWAWTGRALARRIVQAFCQQIFVDGVYHADPHPGNMLVGPEGELILLDFGAVGELSPQMREGIPEFLEAVIRRDTDAIIKALRKMGFLARGAEVDVSEKVIEFFHQRFQEEVKLESFNLKDIKLDPQKGIESLVDLRKMNIGLKELSGAFHVPRDFVLLERTILLLTGVCTELDPELNPMEVIRPYMQEFVLGNRDWAQIALEAAKDMGLKALTIPDDLRKYLTRANRGEAEVRVKGLAQAAAVVYARHAPARLRGDRPRGGLRGARSSTSPDTPAPGAVLPLRRAARWARSSLLSIVFTRTR